MTKCMWDNIQDKLCEYIQKNGNEPAKAIVSYQMLEYIRAHSEKKTGLDADTLFGYPIEFDTTKGGMYIEFINMDGQ